VGDPSTFPSNVALIVGPGVKEAYLPGYPAKQDSPVLETDFANREVKELDFTSSDLHIGGLKALDYFGDGSFYLLDAPGHSIGHVNALARTTEDSFLLFAGDAYHHPSQLRPSGEVRLPDHFDIPNFVPRPCPCELIKRMSPAHSSTEPFSNPGSVSHDKEKAQHTIQCLQEFDADENVLVIAAHDLSLRPYLDVFPEVANGWKSKGWKYRSRWQFLKDFKTALEMIR
jgi:glyoxylase-like metal-dependent hydrolase (beta-lactamase superfamily II)